MYIYGKKPINMHSMLSKIEVSQFRLFKNTHVTLECFCWAAGIHVTYWPCKLKLPDGTRWKKKKKGNVMI